MKSYRRLIVVLLVAGSAILGGTSSAFAQRDALPDADYYQGFFDYYRADYNDAIKRFTSGANTAFKIGETRFLDSVCYWTMMGECHYHMGNYGEAIELYEMALELYLEFCTRQWQRRVTPPAAIQTAGNAVARAQITWGASKRAATISQVPNVLQVQFGRVDAGRAWVEGGSLNPAELRKVDVQEIMRCTALALHRRRAIKGPTCKVDPFTARIASSLTRTGAGNGSMFGAWNGVLLGIARASADDPQGAVRLLTSSLQFSGGMDHVLTPVALVELARLAFEQGDSQAAGELALEASYIAAVFNQYDMVEEALSLATTAHLMNLRTPFPVLEPAIQWAASNKVRLMQASLTTRLAESFAEAGQAADAAQVLSQLRRATSRTSLNQAVVGSRALYVSSVIHFLNGDYERGMKELGEFTQRFQKGSLWMYRLALADNLVVSGAITPRQGDSLYTILLHDPSSLEWRIDPMEAITFLTSPHVSAMERWFEIKVNAKNVEQALNVADLVRRHRFYATLPLGGRLLAFRWVMEAPREALSKEAFRQRQDFLIRYPEYKALADRAEQIHSELLLLPIKPEKDTDELKKQTALFVELAKNCDTREAMLASFALRREPAELAFPPELELSKYRNQIGEDQLALVSLATEAGYHTFLVGAEGERYLGLGSVRDVHRALGRMLKQLGLQDTSGGLEPEILQDETWKTTAYELGSSLFSLANDSDWEKYRELVIVPDGVLWYLPFEILPIGPDVENSVPLAEKTTIRYSPTLSLAFGIQRPTRQLNRTAVVATRMHPKAEKEVALAAVNALQQDLTTAATFVDKIRIPTNYLGSVIDQLIVWSDLRLPSRGGPYSLSPAQLDQGRTGSTLAQWLSLPLAGPEHVILPGYTSDGAAGIKSRSNGQEIFQTVCAMLASGSRTILLSRWRVGGQNSLELTRNYATRLKSMRPTEALAESIKLAKELDLSPELEPRLRVIKDLDQPLKASHPFFWAGNILVEVPNQMTVATDGVPVNQPADDPDGADMKGAADPNADPQAAGAGGNANGGDDGDPDDTGADGQKELKQGDPAEPAKTSDEKKGSDSGANPQQGGESSTKKPGDKKGTGQGTGDADKGGKGNLN